MKNRLSNTTAAARGGRFIGGIGLGLLSLAALSTPALAQDTLRTRYGIFGQGAMSTHTADFQSIPGTESCCAGFTGGTGTGIGAGALVEVPLSQAILLGGRVALLTQPFTMSTTEDTRVIVAGVGQDGAFDHRLTGSLMTVGAEPMIGIRPVGSLLIYAGARVGLTVSSSYEQKDQLTQPSGAGTFMASDGTDSQKRTRNEYSGALPDPALQIAPLVGISYELPMNGDRTFLLAPEVMYQLGVTNVLKDAEWKVNTLRAGIALKYSPRSDERSVRHENIVRADTVRVTVPVITQAFARGQEVRTTTTSETSDAIVTTDIVRRTDTIFVKGSEQRLAATINAVGVEADGREFPIARLRVEEFSSTLMTPLLPYIFFDEGGDRIPDRYSDLQNSETAGFDIDRINSPERLPTYHHLLNIVGRRLLDNPKATITLTGCNQDIRGEKGDVALSRRRAEAVKEYLTSVWKIADSRIRLEARNLPAKAANTQTDDGAEENRRVEITSNEQKILAPIITNDTLRTVDPPVIRFRTTAIADAGIDSWKLTAGQAASMLKELDGKESVPGTIDWNISRESRTIPRNAESIAYALSVTDDNGAGTRAGNELPVEQVTIRKKKVERRGDKEIDRFSLILFDVRSAELLRDHQPIIALIKSYIRPNSTVTVTGYTDRLGDLEYNQQLAESRAASVVKALGKGSSSSKGIGEADLYTSSLPEGRLYTRTVDVVLETPVKE